MVDLAGMFKHGLSWSAQSVCSHMLGHGWLNKYVQTLLALVDLIRCPTMLSHGRLDKHIPTYAVSNGRLNKYVQPCLVMIELTSQQACSNSFSHRRLNKDHTYLAWWL